MSLRPSRAEPRRLGGASARALTRRECPAALEFLRRETRRNLFLIDLVEGVGDPPSPGESPTELVALWRRRSLVGVGAVRPCVVLAAEVDAAAVSAFLPFLDGFLSGLVKTPADSGDAIECRLAENGRRFIGFGHVVDR